MILFICSYDFNSYICENNKEESYNMLIFRKESRNIIKKFNMVIN